MRLVMVWSVVGPTHDDFLAKIRAEPHNDLWRLEYADWLEEHGEPEQAEFIRVQCELVNYTPPKCSWCGATTLCESMDCPHPGIRPYERLRARERTLFAAHSAAWWPGLLVALSLPQLTGSTPGCVVRRGFVDEWHGPAGAWCGSGPCAECEGTGFAYYEGSHGRTYRDTCAACRGSTNAPGVGPSVVRAPGVVLTGVRLVDREPWMSMRNGTPVYWWIHGSDTDSRLSEPAVIPNMLWGTGVNLNPLGQFPSADAAHAALSAAALAWAWSVGPAR